jgi:hypothetical protein
VILARLVEVRASLDHAIARWPAETARDVRQGPDAPADPDGDQRSGAAPRLRPLVRRGARRRGPGPDHALRLLVAIGDVAIGVARASTADDPRVCRWRSTTRAADRAPGQRRHRRRARPARLAQLPAAAGGRR